MPFHHGYAPKKIKPIDCYGISEYLSKRKTKKIFESLDKTFGKRKRPKSMYRSTFGFLVGVD